MTILISSLNIGSYRPVHFQALLTHKQIYLKKKPTLGLTHNYLTKRKQHLIFAYMLKCFGKLPHMLDLCT